MLLFSRKIWYNNNHTMNDKKLPIKDDINFLEYPNWIVSERSDSKTLTIEKKNGRYVISTTENIDRLPDRTDKIVLYYLLHIILPTKENKLITTRYSILKNAFGSTSRHYYERIMKSLDRWAAIYIKFDGIFYKDNGYTTRGFHIIDGYQLNEDDILEIYFNEQYLEQLRNTNYFKLINFNEYKRLKRPVSARLYEILIKTFKDRDIWEIGIANLAEKLTLEKREGNENYYPSDVLIKIQPAVNEINSKTELKAALDYNKETCTCTFTKVKQVQVDKSEAVQQETKLPEDETIKALTSLLPTEHQGKNTILESIADFYKKQGFDYTARNIKYTNRHCKGNYRAYLDKAMKEDWGLAMEEDEKRQQKLREEEERQRQKEREEIKHQEELNRQVKDHMKHLSFEEIETLRKEAVSHLDEKTKRSAQSFNVLETIIKAEIEEIIKNRLINEEKNR
jgi:uncharacterized FlaG/YvyC family protein